MACGNFRLETQYLGHEIDCCTLRFFDTRDNTTLRTINLNDADIIGPQYTNGPYTVRDTITSQELSDAELAQLGISIADIEQASKDCKCGTASTPTDEYVGLTVTDLCRVSDGEKVKIVIREKIDGTLEYSTLQGGTALTQAQIDNDYASCTIDTNTTELIVDATNQSLPTSFPECQDYVFIDIDNMNSDFDISTWTPLGLCDGAIVRFRKIDKSVHKITFNDGTINHDHVNRMNEFITLVWDETTASFNVI